MNDLSYKNIRLSIVIAAWNGNPALRECLESLENQTDKGESEIIVAANFPLDFPASDFSIPVKLIDPAETATVPELRRAGIEAARGEIVALVEDQCLFDSRWSAEIKRAYEAGARAVGGSVENASGGNALDWAVYFYDYGRYMLPNEAGTVEDLSGMNVSYKRELLEELGEFYRQGFFEAFFNEEVKRRGHQLVMAPAAIVYHNKNYRVKRAAEHCYHLARSYAARRAAGSGRFKQIVLTAASLGLPVLLSTRIVFSTLKKGRHLARLTGSLPHLFFLMTIWSCGEFCGYLLGEGNSADKWK